jgi:hypothetical protein
MKESLRQLRELQTERREHEETEMDNAIRLLKTQQMKGLPYDPDAAVNGIGVLYASARRDLLHDSLAAEEAGFNLAQYTARTQGEAA